MRPMKTTKVCKSSARSRLRFRPVQKVPWTLRWCHAWMTSSSSPERSMRTEVCILFGMQLNNMCRKCGKVAGLRRREESRGREEKR